MAKEHTKSRERQTRKRDGRDNEIKVIGMSRGEGRGKETSFMAGTDFSDLQVKKALVFAS